MTIAARDLRTLRVGAILNLSSGHCDTGAEARMRAILEAAGSIPVDLACVDGPALAAGLERIIGQSVDVLIVLGGDGTIRTAAEACGAAKTILMPLPGGTMNMLPKALYGGRSWEEALADTLANPAIRVVSGGVVEGHHFFCAGIFGTAALWTGVREAAREGRIGKIFDQARSAFRRRFSARLAYRFAPDMAGKAEAIAVLCPLISKSLSPDAGTLEAAALDPAGGLAAFRLAMTALFADWRNDESVSTMATTSVEIAGRKAIPAILDGEIVQLPARIRITLERSAFRALVPADGTGERPS